MDYKINIEFVANEEKAGKLSVQDENGRMILSKVPVAIPYKIGMFTQKTDLQTNIIEESLKNSEDAELKQLYNIAYSNLKKSHSLEGMRNIHGEVETINTAKGEIVIVGQVINDENKRLKSDSNLFILKEKDFKVLSQITSNKNNNVNLYAEKVAFLWMPEKVEKSTVTLSMLLNEIRGIEDVAKKEAQKVKTQTKTKTEIKSDASKSSSLYSQSSKVLQKEIPNKEVIKPVTPKLDTKKVKPISQPNNRSNFNTDSRVNSYNASNNLDPFDVFFIYSNPELAPFYRPNSLLAWMVYFGNDTSNLSRQYVMDNINKVPGFQNIAGSDFKYTEKGYSVTLYEDEQKTKSAGVLVYDNSQKADCYKVISPSGETSYIEQDNRGVWSGCTQNTKGDELSYSFAPSDSGYVGNWTATPNDGVQVTSGINLDSSFQMNSTPNETVNLDSYVKEYNMSSISVNDVQNFSYDIKPVYENTAPAYEYKPEEPKYDNDFRDTPPPPPPPPPDDTMSWASSQDSYSSFRM